MKNYYFCVVVGEQKGFARSTKIDFMRLRNESTLTMILVKISTEIIY